MCQSASSKTTRTSTLDLGFVNYLVINIEKHYNIDDSHSNNEKHASNHHSLSIEIPWNSGGKINLRSFHFSFCRANADSMKDHILLLSVFTTFSVLTNIFGCGNVLLDDYDDISRRNIGYYAIP